MPTARAHGCACREGGLLFEESDGITGLEMHPSVNLGIATGEATRASIRTSNIGSSLFRLPLRVFPVAPTFSLSQLDLRLR